MYVMVTGGAGYIGSHTCKALHLAGFQPVVFDNLSTGHQWAVKWGPLIKGDLCEIELLRRTICEFQIRYVIHFAASAYVGESISHPRQYFRNNVVNSLNLLDAMVAEGAAGIVFSSSCATYGIPGQIPISEIHPQIPVSPYGESKLFVERALQWYGQAYGINWAILRYFNAAGADPEGELGEEHDPETHLIPLLLQAALGGTRSFQLYGNDYPTPDGTAIRDFVHVCDLAEAHVRALTNMIDGAGNLTLNLGTGKGYSIREVAQQVESVVGVPIPIQEAPKRAGDPPALVADTTRANAKGWTPRNSALENIIRTALQWRTQHGVRIAEI
jgi:UDP-glucose-4-epimerase GalE